MSLLFVVWLLSSWLAPSPAFQFAQSKDYPVQRWVKGVPYFVEPGFEKRFPTTDSQKTVERAVLEAWLEHLQQQCQVEWRNRQSQMTWASRARREQLGKIPLETCERLEAFRKRVSEKE